MSRNPIAKRLSGASILMETTPFPELADALRIGANEIERLQRQLDGRRDAVRTALADYMMSEGASYYRDHKAHDVNRARLGELLEVPKDEEGWHYFSWYRTKPEEGAPASGSKP